MLSGQRTASGRQIATPIEIDRFLNVWRDLVTHCARANLQFRPGITLGTPKLRSLITESLAVHLVNDGNLRVALPDVCHATLAGGTGDQPDVRVTRANGAAATLEVKSTGPATWQRASAKDAASDFFLWINLAPLCNGEGVAHVWVLRRPQQHLYAGMDWRSEEQFSEFTREEAIRVVVHLEDVARQFAA